MNIKSKDFHTLVKPSSVKEINILMSPQTYQTVYIKYVHFLKICHLYRIKAVLNKKTKNFQNIEYKFR